MLTGHAFGSAGRWHRIALIVGIPDLTVLLAALLVGATLVLFRLGSAGAIGARDDFVTVRGPVGGCSGCRPGRVPGRGPG